MTELVAEVTSDLSSQASLQAEINSSEESGTTFALNPSDECKESVSSINSSSINSSILESPSEYSEEQEKENSVTTPTEPSSLSSGMLVSSCSTVDDEDIAVKPSSSGGSTPPESPSTTGSTVDACDEYYSTESDLLPAEEEGPEYQPEGYRNITTSYSEGSSGSDVLFSLDTLTATDHSSPRQPTDEHVVKKDLVKECKEVINSCDEVLGTVDGSHLDMSTVSIISTGSLNTTTDLGSPKHANEQEEAEESGSTSSTAITIEEDYVEFTRGVKTVSTPEYESQNDQPTQVYAEQTAQKRPIQTSSSDEESKLTKPKKKKFKKATKKSQIKKSDTKKKTAIRSVSPEVADATDGIQNETQKKSTNIAVTSSPGRNRSSRESRKKLSPRAPIRGWRRSNVSAAGKNKVRVIAQRLMPGLYASSSPEKKPPPKSTRRKSSPSCKDAWLDKIMKDGDDDGNGSSESIEIESQIEKNNAEEDQGEEDEEPIPHEKNTAVAGKLIDVYSFREEDDKEEENSGTLLQATTPEHDAEEPSGFAADVGSSMKFNNPELSKSLGPLNNPFRSTGWVKTCCGQSPPDTDMVSDDDNDDDDNDDDDSADRNSPGPMWGAPIDSDCEDDLELFDDPMGDERSGSESDVEKGQLFGYNKRKSLICSCFNLHSFFYKCIFL